MRLETRYKPHAPVTLKRLEAACNDLNNQLGLSHSVYNEHGEPQASYKMSAAYGGYRLEYWTGRGGCYDQTHRTTAKELYLIINAIISGLKAGKAKTIKLTGNMREVIE